MPSPYSPVAGFSATPNIRSTIRTECHNGTGNTAYMYDKLCDVVDGSNGVCEHGPKRFMRPMSQASFCLQTRGHFHSEVNV